MQTARSAAQAFVDHLNSVLNATVTDSRLSLLPLPYDEAAFEVRRLVEAEATPLELHGSDLRLFVRQTIVVDGEGHCQTESYSYRLQRDPGRESWILRWEYFRDPPRPDYPYPLGHLHANAELAAGEPIGRLHLPTRRVPLELVLWHLLAEWRIDSRSPDWQRRLADSISGFDERRTQS